MFVKILKSDDKLRVLFHAPLDRWHKIFRLILFGKPAGEIAVGTCPVGPAMSQSPLGYVGSTIHNFLFFRLWFHAPLGDMVGLPRCQACADVCLHVWLIFVLRIWVRHNVFFIGLVGRCCRCLHRYNFFSRWCVHRDHFFYRWCRCLGFGPRRWYLL